MTRHADVSDTSYMCAPQITNTINAEVTTQNRTLDNLVGVHSGLWRLVRFKLSQRV